MPNPPGAVFPFCTTHLAASSTVEICKVLLLLIGVKIEESQPTSTPQTLPLIAIDTSHEPTKCRSMRDYSLKHNQTPVLCDADGRFSALQVDFSLGYIWCVNQDNGLEIYGTRKLSGGVPVTCPGTNSKASLFIVFFVTCCLFRVLFVSSFQPKN